MNHFEHSPLVGPTWLTAWLRPVACRLEGVLSGADRSQTLGVACAAWSSCLDGAATYQASMSFTAQTESDVSWNATEGIPPIIGAQMQGLGIRNYIPGFRKYAFWTKIFAQFVPFQLAYVILLCCTKTCAWQWVGRINQAIIAFKDPGIIIMEFRLQGRVQGVKWLHYNHLTEPQGIHGSNFQRCCLSWE